MKVHLKGHGDNCLVLPGEGPAPKPLFDIPHDRKIIWIPAVPSSGTSMLSGVLARLGVDMGQVNNKPNMQRGYQMFEDVDVGMFSFSPNSPQDKLIKDHLRLREYINYRFHTNKEGPVGVKATAIQWVRDPDITSLPVRIVDISRDLEEAIDADMVRLAKRPERDPSQPHLSPYQHCNRAAGVAACWEAKRLLYKAIKPEISFLFNDFKRDAPGCIEELVEALGLEPTDRQMTEALLSVRT
jgi:hypothetical protein